jgi:hypothetical protein
VVKLRINFGPQVTAIAGVIQSVCFLFAGFKIVKKIIYYSIFLLDLVIVYYESIVLWITLSAILKPRIW